jgi:hypothetical protein
MVADRTRFEKPPNGARSSRSREWVDENPFTAVTVLFGLGVGVGLLLGHTIAESAGRALFHEDTLTEKLTSQIRDVLKSTLPKGLSRHLS